MLVRISSIFNRNLTKSVPTEAYNQSGTVEISHAILRSMYDDLKIDLSSLRGEKRLAMAFRATNDAPAKGSGI